MAPESNYYDAKARMPEVKELFQSRHYAQCSSLCERLLTRSNDMLPIHQAYINFYLALSHDTMVRETSARYRLSSIDLAEKHYLAAIAALAPSQLHQLDDIEEAQTPSSPDSADGSDNERQQFDTASVNSEHSVSTSATSYSEEAEVEEFGPQSASKHTNYYKGLQSSKTTSDGSSMNPKLVRARRPTSIVTSHAKRSSHNEQLSGHVTSFIDMLNSHLASLRELRDTRTGPTTRYSGFASRSRGSSFNSRPSSRDCASNGDVMEKIRWSRKSISFRPRFDPQSVRDLCRDALAEL